MRPTRIGDKYKEVIKKLSADLKDEGGNTKKIERLNKSIPYVELFIEHLRKNPDILNKYFNISEDDDSKILNIWNNIEDLKILEKINLDKNELTELTEMKLPRNLVASSTVLSVADIPVVIDLHNTQMLPIDNRVNYQYNTVSFPLHRNNSIILANQGALPQYPQYPQYPRYSQFPQHPQHPQHLRHSHFSPHQQFMQQHLRHSQYPQHPQYRQLTHRSAPPLAPRSAPPIDPRSAPPIAQQLRPQFPKVLQVKPISSNRLTSMIMTDVDAYRNKLIQGGKSKNNKVALTETKVKETKKLFTKLLKSNKYIKYNKHLYVRYDKYLLSVPVLIAYITYNKKSKAKK